MADCDSVTHGAILGGEGQILSYSNTLNLITCLLVFFARGIQWKHLKRARMIASSPKLLVAKFFTRVDAFARRRA